VVTVTTGTAAVVEAAVVTSAFHDTVSNKLATAGVDTTLGLIDDVRGLIDGAADAAIASGATSITMFIEEPGKCWKDGSEAQPHPHEEAASYMVFTATAFADSIAALTATATVKFDLQVENFNQADLPAYTTAIAASLGVDESRVTVTYSAACADDAFWKWRADGQGCAWAAAGNPTTGGNSWHCTQDSEFGVHASAGTLASVACPVACGTCPDSRRLVEATTTTETLEVTVTTGTAAVVEAEIATSTFSGTISDELATAGVVTDVVIDPATVTAVAATCSVTCAISSNTLKVTHDTTSQHTHHKCYQMDQQACICSCCNSASSDCNVMSNYQL
jgi:hypothetical protein